MDGIQPGDRVPNFRRLDQAGEVQTLHRLHHGQAMAFIVLPATPQVLSENIKEQLLAEHPVWAQVSRIALIPAAPDVTRQFQQSCPLPFPVLADDCSLCRHLTGAERSHASWFLTDTNLRLLKRAPLDGGESQCSLGDAVQSALLEMPRNAPQIIRDPAPVLILPRVLESTLCNDLIATFDKDGGQPSGVLHLDGDEKRWQPDPETKIRRDLTLQSSGLSQQITDSLRRRVLPEVQRVFNFQITRHEPFKLVRYSADTGGYFRPHRDNVTKDVYYRRFAMTINLNDPDSYSGGQLRFPEFGPHLYQPPAGGAIVFSCSLVHEALDVTDGVRYALLAFFYNEASMGKRG